MGSKWKQVLQAKFHFKHTELCYEKHMEISLTVGQQKLNLRKAIDIRLARVRLSRPGNPRRRRQQVARCLENTRQGFLMSIAP